MTITSPDAIRKHGLAAKVAITLTILASVLALAACSSRSTNPSPLSLGSRANGINAAAKLDSGPSAGSPTAGPSNEFPATPADGPVLTPTNDVTTAKVQALATALGLTFPVVEKPGGWISPDARSSPPQTRFLIVLKDARGTWTYGSQTTCDISAPITDAGSCVSTAVATPIPPVAQNAPTPGATTASPPTRTTPTLSVSDQQFSAIVDPVLKNVGITDSARLTYSPATSASERSVEANPVVADLPTVGIATYISVMSRLPSPIIDQASGQLATWKLKDRYGVISAQDGLARLAALPQAALALCALSPDGKGCIAPATPTIVKTEFGLMADTDNGLPVLAPAWLFTTTSEANLVVGVTTESLVSVSAVADKYLATPTPIPNSPQATDQPLPIPSAVPGSAGSGAGQSEPGNPGSPTGN